MRILIPLFLLAAPAFGQERYELVELTVIDGSKVTVRRAVAESASEVFYRLQRHNIDAAQRLPPPVIYRVPVNCSTSG